MQTKRFTSGELAKLRKRGGSMNAKVMKEGSAEASSVSLSLLDHKTGTINKEYNRTDCDIYSFPVDDEYSLLLIKFNIYINGTLSSIYTSLGHQVTGYGVNDGILLSTSGSGSIMVGSAFAYRRNSNWQYNNISSSVGGTQYPCYFSSYQLGSNYQWSATIEYDISIYGF